MKTIRAFLIAILFAATVAQLANAQALQDSAAKTYRVSKTLHDSLIHGYQMDGFQGRRNVPGLRRNAHVRSGESVRLFD
jgi:hypothetical protein